MTPTLHTHLEPRPIEALIPYARNSRTHSDAQVAQVAASIREFGFTNPVLIDEQGGIIAGHGRVMAARKLGLAEVPCLTLAGLTEAQKRAYVIADNKLALNAGWDEDLLALELAAITEAGIDITITGFDQAEFDREIRATSQEMGMADMRATEPKADQYTPPETDAQFAAEMEDPATVGLAPIVPAYAEHHQAFIIVCDNQIDEAWLRQKLKLEAPRKSYKDQKILQANIITIADLKRLIQ